MKSLFKFLPLLFVLVLGCTANDDMNDQPTWTFYEMPEALRGRPLTPVGAVRYVGPEMKTQLPTIQMDTLEKGEALHQTYCLPCHGSGGDGHGPIVGHGFTTRPASYHQDRVRKKSVTEIEDVIRNGYKTMMPMQDQLTNVEIFEIANYVKVLQRAYQNRKEDKR